MKLTFEIKLLNRIKPVGMDGYKKAMKLPMHLRSIDSDHLNRFRKQSREMDSSEAHRIYGQELEKLAESLPWKIQKNPDFGDLLIGSITTVEFDDFYNEIYLPVRPIV